MDGRIADHGEKNVQLAIGLVLSSTVKTGIDNCVNEVDNLKEASTVTMKRAMSEICNIDESVEHGLYSAAKQSFVDKFVYDVESFESSTKACGHIGNTALKDNSYLKHGVLESHETTRQWSIFYNWTSGELPESNANKMQIDFGEDSVPCEAIDSIRVENITVPDCSNASRYELDDSMNCFFAKVENGYVNDSMRKIEERKSYELRVGDRLVTENADGNVSVCMGSTGNATNGSFVASVCLDDSDDSMGSFSIYRLSNEATSNDEDRKSNENSSNPPEGGFDDASDGEACVVSIDSLKYGEYKLNTDEHVVRITQKDIYIDAVTFHHCSIQIDFHCLSRSNPLLEKYNVGRNTSFIWHAELSGEIIPGECGMRYSDREFVLKKRDASQWSTGLLHCSSSSSISSSSYQPSFRNPSSRYSGSYRYSGISSYCRTNLPPSSSNTSAVANRASYLSYVYTPKSLAAFSPLTHTPHTTVVPESNTNTVRSVSTSSLPRRFVSSANGSNEKDDMDVESQQKHPFGRPTALVSPYDEQGTVVDRGFTGLRNIGNTCFMNATLQMLVNCKELQVYFLGTYYKKDINSVNPLGFGGRLANAFAEFMKKMCSCMHKVIEPSTVKELVAEKASQFANFAQHDAHEFLSFLLDGLHEDLNRVRAKPNTGTIEPRGRPDAEVAKEAWDNHILRNDSIFVDLFHGQLKSRLQCPQCSQISVTFDPFVYLAVPFPKEKRSLCVHYWPLDPHLKPFKLNIRFSSDAALSEVLSSVSQLINVSARSLRMIEVSGHRISKVFAAEESANTILSTDTIYVFQIDDPAECGEEVVELFVIQRLLYHKSVTRVCANCHTTDGALKVCDGCYDSFYCKKDCQKQHWINQHKDRCRLRTRADPVGESFVISLPKSKVTYANIIRNLEARCRYSVNVFQPPIESKESLIEYNKPSDSFLETSVPVPCNAGNDSDSPEKAKSNEVKRQMIVGEPRSRQLHDSQLFLVRKLQSAEKVLGQIITASDEVLDIPSLTFLSINWINMRGGKDYLTVESKEDVDIDSEKTEHYRRISTSSVNRNSSPSTPSLYDMLFMFSETEHLKPEESWYCNRCKEHVEATKQLMLYRLPPILIVQLKRFVYTSSLMTIQRRSKDERIVKYPVEGLNLSSFLCDTADQNQETLYDLTGVVCHWGSSYFGHYVSVGRLQSLDGSTTEIDWRTFDDSMVTRAPTTKVQNPDAYLLFYKQRGCGTEKLFKSKYGYHMGC